MTRFSIVILHYNLIEDTTRLTNFLIEQNSEINSIQVIIVDNNSPNKSGIDLTRQYKDTSEVHVILSPENLGFARGNNLGYQYAINTFSPDFIILSNNDITIPNNNFFSKIDKIYEQERFGILGPDIYAPIKRVHQNPRRIKFDYSFKKIEKELNESKKKLLFFKKIEKNSILKYLYRLKKVFSMNISRLKIKYLKKSENWKESRINIELYGAFLILSQEFMHKFPEGLSEITFMYEEESILNYMAIKNEVKTLYQPEICVEHWESKSTNNLFEKDKMIKKAIFYFENRIKSLEGFLSLIEER